MTDILSALAGQCCEENRTMADCRRAEGKTLSDFIREAAEKVTGNKAVPPLADPQDLFDRVHGRVSALLGTEAADQAVRVFRMGAACTADHHGGLYFAQSFQGDMLFSLLLERLGSAESVVPILCAGQVELENASYARGICASMSEEGKQYFPIFPAKESVRLASYTQPIDADMLGRFRHRFVDGPEAAGLSPVLDRLLREAYEREDILSQRRFSDQVTRIGAALSGHLFSDEKKTFVYLEMEDLLMPLLQKALKDPASLLCRLLSGGHMRKAMAGEKLPDGSSLLDHLFWGADEKGRKLHMTLTEDGMLAGRDWRGGSVCYAADTASLAGLLAEGRIFPDVFTLALISFFERGLTWLGGMFQCLYLPAYQKALTAVLSASGLWEEARVIGAYDCSGYISGPVFALYAGDGFSTVVSPTEAFGNRLSMARVRETALRTPLWSAHLMGLSDIYFDLIPRRRRYENWYREIARQLYARYPDNVLLNAET